jgi:hypothetical protein
MVRLYVLEILTAKCVKGKSASKEWQSMKSGRTGFKIGLKGIASRGEGRRSNCMY